MQKQNTGLTEILGIGISAAYLGLASILGGGCASEHYIPKPAIERSALDEIYRRIDLAEFDEGYTDDIKAKLKTSYRDLTKRALTEEEKEFIEMFDQHISGPRKEEFQEELKRHPYVDLKKITEGDKVIIMGIIKTREELLHEMWLRSGYLIPCRPCK